MKNISILIPYRSDKGPRDVIFNWVKDFYNRLLPEAEICVGCCNTNLFSRSQAVNNAARKATGDIFIIADADIVYDPVLINEAINLLDNHAWIVPYSDIQYITEDSTKKLLNTEVIWPIKLELELNPFNAYIGNITGGLVIIPRKHFESVNGFDQRFLGWGGEDDAFTFSVNTICGHFKRLDRSIYHLWHPPVKAIGNPHYEMNYSLYTRYAHASNNPEIMRQLILEKKQ
ncbi:galactosyltransferase-related protein [Bacillus sp. FSL R10-2201]|uniref:galactosyltransferase-related protein n=1 Tax=Bacillus sp. FSL R10-2201 TaxID=2954657 RepID=UPI0030FB3EE6